jgi:hypothetical protein
MRLEDLAVRLVTVEAKLASLTGTTVNTDIASSIEEMDARLSVVEVQVDQLIAEKTANHKDSIIIAAANDAPVDVSEVVALSASVYNEEAASIVADVVIAQTEAEAIVNPEVADIVSAAIMAVVTAEPEVVLDAVAITAAITDAVAEMPVPSPEVAEQVATAIAEVIATATGVDTVSPEVQQQVVDAVAAPSDTALDSIESRLDVAEAKVDFLLGK